jgi:hypothetical protein
MRKKLADNDAHGDVATCGQCRNVHIRWDNLMLSLSPKQFDAFSRMITEARSNLAQGPGAAPTRGIAPEAWIQ